MRTFVLSLCAMTLLVGFVRPEDPTKVKVCRTPQEVFELTKKFFTMEILTGKGKVSRKQIRELFQIMTKKSQDHSLGQSFLKALNAVRSTSNRPQDLAKKQQYLELFAKYGLKGEKLTSIKTPRNGLPGYIALAKKHITNAAGFATDAQLIATRTTLPKNIGVPKISLKDLKVMGDTASAVLSFEIEGAPPIPPGAFPRIKFVKVGNGWKLALVESLNKGVFK